MTCGIAMLLLRIIQSDGLSRKKTFCEILWRCEKWKSYSPWVNKRKLRLKMSQLLRMFKKNDNRQCFRNFLSECLGCPIKVHYSIVFQFADFTSFARLRHTSFQNKFGSFLIIPKVNSNPLFRKSDFSIFEVVSKSFTHFSV